MLRKAVHLRTLIAVLLGAVLVTAVACGEDPTATPQPTNTSVPTATPEPTATSAEEMMEPTEAPVAETSQANTGLSAQAVMDHPMFRPEWGEPQYGGTIRLRTNVPVRTGSPYRGSGNSHYTGNQMTTRDTLVMIDPWIGWSGGIQGNLAESWEVSDDQLTYTFHLRQGIKFHERTEAHQVEMPGYGQELVCEDVASHMNFIGSDRYWDEGGSLSSLVPGGTTWTCPDGPEGYVAQGVLDSGIPFPGILNLLSMPGVYGITNKDWLDWSLETLEIQEMRTYPEYTIHLGTGPFMPHDLTPEVVATVHKNPNYWKDGLPFLDVFEYHSIADPATAFASFSTGKIDLMGHGSGSPYPAQVEQANRDFPDLAFAPNHYFGGRAVGFNTEKPPFDDWRVRRAVNLVMDREAWKEFQNIPGTDLYAGYIPAGFFNAEGRAFNPMGHSLEEILTWDGWRSPKDDDIALAVSIMDEIYGPGERPGPFKCLSRADDTSTNACIFMGGLIQEHLGMDLSLDTYDPATLSSQTRACKHTFAVTVMPGWEGTPDPYLRYRAYHSEIQGARACMGGVDPDVQGRVNSLIDEFLVELDFTKRTEISKEIESIMYNEFIPAAPMEWQVLFTGYQPWVKGFDILPDHSIHTSHLKIHQRTWVAR
jgi:ABC-type transport system substrate-binding protein